MGLATIQLCKVLFKNITIIVTAGKFLFFMLDMQALCVCVRACVCVLCVCGHIFGGFCNKNDSDKYIMRYSLDFHKCVFVCEKTSFRSYGVVLQHPLVLIV